MPQPLSKVRANATIHVGPGSLIRVPEFLPQIMRVISTLASIDGTWGSIFSRLLRTDIETGTAVYQAFNGLEARRIALFAAAEKALLEWQMIALRAVWNQTAAARSQRDKFAHHVWGFSPDLPDALLLMNSSVIVDVSVSYRQRTEHLPEGRGVIAPKDYDRSQVFVYRKGDFDRAAKEADEAGWIVSQLYMVVGHDPIEQARRQLWNEPRFQRAVQPLIREKSLEVQAQLRPPGDDPPVKGISKVWDRALGRSV